METVKLSKGESMTSGSLSHEEVFTNCVDAVIVEECEATISTAKKVEDVTETF